MEDFASVDLSMSYSADVWGDIEFGKLRASILLLDDESVQDGGIASELLAKYGAMFLCVEIPEESDTPETREFLKSVFEIIHVVPGNTSKLFINSVEQFAQSCIYVFGNLKVVVDAMIDNKLFTQAAAVPLNLGIEQGTQDAAARNAGKRPPQKDAGIIFPAASNG